MRLDAQKYSLKLIDFVMYKHKIFSKFSTLLNDQQIKVLSAENYVSIAKKSRATVPRDLQQLVDLGILKRKGEKKHTLYFLGFSKYGVIIIYIKRIDYVDFNPYNILN